MNIKKNSKIHTDISPQSKSFLIISSNYNIESLYHLLIKNPSYINKKDQKGETFLSYAIKRKNIEIAELILTSPILDYSYQDQNGNSYLHLAMINQLENIIRTLIKKGINLNLQNNDGNTAFHFAYSTGDIKFITIMIESKADPLIKNNNGVIPEDIMPGAFPEILDINNSSILGNNLKITHNKNNTVLINLNVVDENKDNNDNNKDNEKDNNNIIINDRGQVNKSIKINWEENGINNYEIKDDTNNNINQNENTSKTKLKYSLVNFSYSDDEEEREEEEEENGIILNKSLSKKNEIKKDIKSSDIFDLTSSLSYQEKIANVSSINAHVIGEPNILIKKDNSDLGVEDLVNINKIKTSKNNPTPPLNNISTNDFMINGINMSHQTVYENGRKINISQVNNENENGCNLKSTDYKNDINFKGNGQNYNYNNSMDKERGINNNNNYDNDVEKASGKISNYDNNNLNQSNIYTPQVELNQDFVFSPFTTLKEPLNKIINGSETNNNSNNINNKLNNLYTLNNNNPNNINNININNNEINVQNKNLSENKNYYNINNNSQNLKRCNALNNNKNINSNINIKQNPYIKKTVSNIHFTNTNLSKVNQNNINSKTNPKIDLNCPINFSQDTLSNSTTKIYRDPLYTFLAEIRMEKYYKNMNSNGLNDIQLLINQTKSGIIIKDKQLKELGIDLPGDRAKILIRLLEKAENFSFPIPQEVYYVCLNDDIKNDKNINKLNDWLSSLKIECYLESFIKNGYHSIELMLLQMETKNPLTDEILRDEIGISKIGHRARIINKLLEEGKSLNNKLKTSMLIMGNGMSEKICDCAIY